MGEASTTSVAVGSVQVTRALPELAPTFMSSGTPWMTGSVVSTTVTLKLPFACMPPLSVTEQLTVVSPSGRTQPAAGEQVGVGAGLSSLSEAQTPE